MWKPQISHAEWLKNAADYITTRADYRCMESSTVLDIDAVLTDGSGRSMSISMYEDSCPLIVRQWDWENTIRIAYIRAHEALTATMGQAGGVTFNHDYLEQATGVDEYTVTLPVLGSGDLMVLVEDDVADAILGVLKWHEGRVREAGLNTLVATRSHVTAPLREDTSQAIQAMQDAIEDRRHFAPYLYAGLWRCGLDTYNTQHPGFPGRESFVLDDIANNLSRHIHQERYRTAQEGLKLLRSQGVKAADMPHVGWGHDEKLNRHEFWGKAERFKRACDQLLERASCERQGMPDENVPTLDGVSVELCRGAHMPIFLFEHEWKWVKDALKDARRLYEQETTDLPGIFGVEQLLNASDITHVAFLPLRDVPSAVAVDGEALRAMRTLISWGERVIDERLETPGQVPAGLSVFAQAEVILDKAEDERRCYYGQYLAAQARLWALDRYNKWASTQEGLNELDASWWWEFDAEPLLAQARYEREQLDSAAQTIANILVLPI